MKFNSRATVKGIALAGTLVMLTAPAGCVEERATVEPSQEAAEAESQPAKAESQPAEVESQPAKAASQPAKAESQPVKVESQPVEAESQPVKVESQPAKAESQPTKAESRPIEDGSWATTDLNDQTVVCFCPEHKLSFNFSVGNPPDNWAQHRSHVVCAPGQ
jgi:hypothetical protein